ncbi:MAG: alpha/beta fold hydrolase [Candidatus Rokuibacteriota bacterium]
MPIVRANGVDIYYEEVGSGVPLVWSHEFGGDYRSWEPQMRYFGRRYRVIAYNHRGYPPSEVPKDPAAYSSAQLVGDLHQLLRALGIREAHVGGLSMGANVALNFGIAYPAMVRSLVIAACGSGSVNREQALAQYAAHADAVERDGIHALLENFDALASRQAFRAKDPRGWEEFRRHAAEHSPQACAHLLRGVIMRRRTIFELETELAALTVPTLIMVGDQDEPCIEPALFMRRHIRRAGLAMLPMSGHTINIEEPGLFNTHVAEFLAAVESGRWGPA